MMNVRIADVDAQIQVGRAPATRPYTNKGLFFQHIVQPGNRLADLVAQCCGGQPEILFRLDEQYKLDILQIALGHHVSRRKDDLLFGDLIGYMYQRGALDIALWAALQ